MPTAEFLSRALKVPLRIVSVAASGSAVEQRRELLDRELGDLRTTVDTIDVTMSLSLAESLNARSDDGTLIVMASSAIPGLEDLVVGTTTSEVLTFCRAPIIAVGPAAGSAASVQFTQMIIGTDSSPPSVLATEAAARLVGALGLDVKVLQVVAPGQKIPADVNESGFVQHVCEEIATTGSKNWDVVHSVHPASALAEEAARTPGAIIAVGTRGMDRLHQLVFGSTTRRLLAESTVPVLVVAANLEAS
jgi:nucleotide-binding universal stress UspA family protein